MHFQPEEVSRLDDEREVFEEECKAADEDLDLQSADSDGKTIDESMVNSNDDITDKITEDISEKHADRGNCDDEFVEEECNELDSPRSQEFPPKEELRYVDNENHTDSQSTKEECQNNPAVSLEEE